MSDFSGNSAKLAIESIRNAYLREHYIQITRQTADAIRQEAHNEESLSPCQKHDVWKSAARKAHRLRNFWMSSTRNSLSSSALAFSRILKSRPPTFSEMVSRYSKKLLESNQIMVEDGEFQCSTKSNTILVYRLIVNSSGRTNSRINVVSKAVGLAGVIFLGIVIAFVIYGFIQSKYSCIYAFKCALAFHAGLLGSFCGSKLGSVTATCCGFSHVVVFILSLFGGLVIGTATVVAGNLVMSSAYSRMYTLNTSKEGLTISLF